MTSRTLTIAIGAALILVANGVALTGVAYNRSGEPDSRLNLSQRELGRPCPLGSRFAADALRGDGVDDDHWCTTVPANEGRARCAIGFIRLRAECGRGV